jgi:hypothetical protein
MHKARLLLFVPFLLLPALGCSGSKTAQAGVHGKITYNGKPVTGGIIAFIPEGSGGNYAGQINPDGTYQIDEVPNGTCSVTIDALPDPGKAAEAYGGARGKQMEEEGAKASKGGMKPGPGGMSPRPPGVEAPNQGQYMKLPDKYSDPKTSGLKANLTKGGNTFNADLTD